MAHCTQHMPRPNLLQPLRLRVKKKAESKGQGRQHSNLIHNFYVADSSQLSQRIWECPLARSLEVSVGGLTERQYSRFPKCECRITSLLGLFSIDLDLGSILGHSGLHLGALACCPKLLTHRRVCCVCESMDMDMAEQVRRCPPVPNFAQCFEQIPNLGRRLRVACPCIGIQ